MAFVEPESKLRQRMRLPSLELLAEDDGPLYSQGWRRQQLEVVVVVAGLLLLEDQERLFVPVVVWLVPK